MESSQPTGNYALILTPAQHPLTKSILSDYFHAHNSHVVSLTNRYYSASVHLHTVTEKELPNRLADSTWINTFSNAPAIVLLAPEGTAEQTHICKQMWSKLSHTIPDTSTKIFLIPKSNPDERDTYNLLSWAAARQIEVITPLSCQEDSITMRDRIVGALECAPWHQTLPNQPKPSEHPTANDRAPADTPRNYPPCKRNDNQLETDQQTNERLSRPTALRRPLDNTDVEKLIHNLLLDESSDEYP